MRAHHQRAIDRLRETYEPDPRYLALIVVGSVAAGRERENSDIDHILVVTDEEYAERRAREAIIYLDRDFCDYPDGYVEGKIVDYGFIAEAARRGSEPARAQFAGAMVVFAKVPGLAELVAGIGAYPEADREHKLRHFHAQFRVLQGYLEYGEQQGEPYIVQWAAAGIALFAGRLILTHNRMFFPYHKWFMREVRRAPDQPADFLALLDAFIAAPTIATGNALGDCVVDFMDLHRYDDDHFGSRFVMTTEWNWRSGGPAVTDW